MKELLEVIKKNSQIRREAEKAVSDCKTPLERLKMRISYLDKSAKLWNESGFV